MTPRQLFNHSQLQRVRKQRELKAWAAAMRRAQHSKDESFNRWLKKE